MKYKALLACSLDSDFSGGWRDNWGQDFIGVDK